MQIRSFYSYILEFHESTRLAEIDVLSFPLIDVREILVTTKKKIVRLNEEGNTINIVVVIHHANGLCYLWYIFLQEHFTFFSFFCHKTFHDLALTIALNLTIRCLRLYHSSKPPPLETVLLPV